MFMIEVLLLFFPLDYVRLDAAFLAYPFGVRVTGHRFLSFVSISLHGSIASSTQG
jgi:hypothetical protein